MARSGFSVTISAADAISAPLAKIGQELRKLSGTAKEVTAQAPRVQSGFLGQAQLFAAYGGRQVNTGLRDLGKGVRETGHQLDRAFSPIAKLGGLSGSIAGALSIAKLTEELNKTKDAGHDLKQLSERIGVNTNEIQKLGGAAELAGSKSASLNSALEILAQNMTAISLGQNADKANLFEQFRISIWATNGVLRQAPGALLDIADAIAKIPNPTIQANTAIALLGPAAVDLLPFLRRGREGIAEFIKMHEKYGHDLSGQGIKYLDDYRIAQVNLKDAIAGTGNAITEQTVKPLAEFTQEMALLVTQNRDWIAQGIGDAVKELAKALKEVNWRDVGQGIKDVGEGFAIIGKSISGFGEGLKAIREFKEWWFGAQVSFGLKPELSPQAGRFSIHQMPGGGYQVFGRTNTPGRGYGLGARAASGGGRGIGGGGPSRTGQRGGPYGEGLPPRGPTSAEDPRGLIPIIHASADRRGIDRDTAVAVARSEGLLGFKSSIAGEESYTAFQLNMQGGLGNVFQRETGLDPRDPKNEHIAIDWALEHASQHGWGPWHGAKNTGISQWQGIGVRPSAGTAVIGTGGGSRLAGFAVGNAVPGGPSPVTDIHPEFAGRIERMTQAMPEGIRQKFEIISGFRSRARQAHVHGAVRDSYHSYGMAADLGNDPEVLAWISQNGHKFGVGFPLASDPKERNHLEPLEGGERIDPADRVGWAERNRPKVEPAAKADDSGISPDAVWKSPEGKSVKEKDMGKRADLGFLQATMAPQHSLDIYINGAPVGTRARIADADGPAKTRLRTKYAMGAA